MKRIPKYLKSEVDVCYMDGVKFVSRKTAEYNTTSEAEAMYTRVTTKYKDGGVIVTLRSHYEDGVTTLKSFRGDYHEVFAKETLKKRGGIFVLKPRK